MNSWKLLRSVAAIFAVWFLGVRVEAPAPAKPA